MLERIIKTFQEYCQEIPLHVLFAWSILIAIALCGIIIGLFIDFFGTAAAVLVILFVVCVITLGSYYLD